MLEPGYAEVVVRFREEAPLVRDRLVATLSSGRHDWYLEGLDLEPAGEEGWFESRPIRIPREGEGDLFVAFRGRGSVAAASGGATLPLVTGRRVTVDVLFSADEPSRVCDGCDGIAQFPILQEFRPPARVWLYLRWTDDR